MTDQHLIEQALSSSQIFQGKFIQAYRDEVQLPNGKIAWREYIKHPGAVAILALDEQNNLIMERQYRHPVQRVIYEIPAGKLDPHESELSCGQRELLEETGYQAGQWILLGECLPCVGYSDERIVYYLAQDLVYTEQQLDDGEFLEVVKQPFSQILELAYTGQIVDSKSLAGIILLQGYLLRNV
ncbi:MAG: hypothetical protein RLZZ293_926 [Pseudomonadota bacterium]|jgi:ADP-ribose pyrophosphatase